MSITLDSNVLDAMIIQKISHHKIPTQTRIFYGNEREWEVNSQYHMELSSKFGILITRFESNKNFWSGQSPGLVIFTAKLAFFGVNFEVRYSIIRAGCLTCSRIISNLLNFPVRYSKINLNKLRSPEIVPIIESLHEIICVIKTQWPIFYWCIL